MHNMLSWFSKYRYLEIFRLDLCSACKLLIYLSSLATWHINFVHLRWLQCNKSLEPGQMPIFFRSLFSCIYCRNIFTAILVLVSCPCFCFCIMYNFFFFVCQDSIVQKVNANPNAGWKASMNSRFSNYTVNIWTYLIIFHLTWHGVSNDVVSC